VPFAALVLGVLAARLALWIDRKTGWTLDFTAEGAKAVADTLTGALLTFIVFVFSVLLLAVQLASAQLTPRIIARVFSDRYTKAAVSIFVFAFTFSVAVLGRIRDPVPLLSGIVAGYGSLACVAVFLFLIDRLGKELRPVRILATVAAEGRRVIAATYPERFKLDATGKGPLVPERAAPPGLGIPSQVIHHQGAAGVLLAFDPHGLLNLAARANCVIEMVPEVGDFVAPDDPLFRIYQGGAAVTEWDLRQSVAFGTERTLEQDPAFVFRIIVDIACKALSPAINDPTTAVLALDQIHHLLRLVGTRQLDTGQVRDRAGALRLVYRTPFWEDFVSLAVTEIRHFGGDSIQVARRLRAMLENLIESLPEPRRPLLRQELSLVKRQAERAFTEPEDLVRADTGDSQGMGGARQGNGQAANQSDTTGETTNRPV